jgi:hypothetical protein
MSLYRSVWSIHSLLLWSFSCSSDLVHHGIDHSYFLMHILSWRLEIDNQSLQKSTNNAQPLSGEVNPHNPCPSVNPTLLEHSRRLGRDAHWPLYCHLPVPMPWWSTAYLALSWLLDLKGKRPKNWGLWANASISLKFKKNWSVEKIVGMEGKGNPTSNSTHELVMTTRFTWQEKATLLVLGICL